MLNVARTQAHPEFAGLTAESALARYDSGLDDVASGPAERQSTSRASSVVTAAFVAAVTSSIANPTSSSFNTSAWSVSRPAIYASVQVQDDRNSVLSAKIAKYRSLVDGWDGLGSVAPSQKAIDDAMIFIDKIPPGAKLPEPTVSADGEVGFFWKSQGVYIDVGLKGDGFISYYGEAPNVAPANGVRPFNKFTRLPEDLARIIKNS
jgi:hypothetical protein